MGMWIQGVVGVLVCGLFGFVLVGVTFCDWLGVFVGLWVCGCIVVWVDERVAV